MLTLTRAALVLSLLALLFPAAALAVELRDAELVAGGSPVLENARLGRVGPTVFVPEPGARVLTPWVVGLVFAFFAASAFAQVPQGTTFTGRLVDDSGNPLTGPVNMVLRVWDAETAGTKLYEEGHPGVPLDATGGFSVELGLGTPVTGTFDAALFSGAERWLEVRVDADVLEPRQPIGSVPWALIAQRANKIGRTRMRRASRTAATGRWRTTRRGFSGSRRPETMALRTSRIRTTWTTRTRGPREPMSPMARRSQTS